MDLFDGEPPASRPAWRVIEAARMRHLTGELSLPSNPPTNIYLINGEVYFAERVTDGGIGVRLLVEGVITRKQMSKGSVMVSGAEHLGRLFERDETIDRHAVELCVELMTDDVLTSVSKEMVDGYTMTLYKRHPSGIDRWLVNESTADAPAVSEDQREAVLADLPPTPVVAAVNGATVPTAVAPVVATPTVATPVVPEPIVVAPAQAPAPQAVMPKLTVPEPVLAQPVLPTATAPINVPEPEPAAEAATAVARTPEPVLRTPERIEFDGWPELDNPTASATAAPAVARATESYPKLPERPVPAASAPTASQTTEDKLPGAIADEVADAVRRALAAIDSVLTPADDPKSQP